MNDVDVAIVGSGPYALSLAAHLRAREVPYRVFGPAMRFWRTMPPGINLKSLAFATNIAVPQAGYRFPEWCRRRGLEDHEPCSMESYAAYGMEIQQRLVPDLEETEITTVRSVGVHRFELTLATGEVLHARNVISATGLSCLAYTPDVLTGVRDHVTHTFTLHSYQRFAGKEVAIIGAGASAIEAGALVHEAGGVAHLIVRGPEATFNTRADPDRSLIDRMLNPDTVLGAGRKNWLLQTLPWGVYFIPEKRRVRLAQRWLPPTAPWWIKDRFEGHVTVHVRTRVVDARMDAHRARLVLRTDGGAERTLSVDHVIAGTGYVLDVDRLEYLDADLRRRIRKVEQAPALSLRFESSVPGLYFVGPLTAFTFGPVFRFVAGAQFAAPVIARRLAARLRYVRTPLPEAPIL
jgi:cation diffusion facilitator CzcD-associated flavoprotein CzcO